MFKTKYIYLVFLTIKINGSLCIKLCGVLGIKKQLNIYQYIYNVLMTLSCIIFFKQAKIQKGSKNLFNTHTQTHTHTLVSGRTVRRCGPQLISTELKHTQHHRRPSSADGKITILSYTRKDAEKNNKEIIKRKYKESKIYYKTLTFQCNIIYNYIYIYNVQHMYIINMIKIFV